MITLLLAASALLKWEPMPEVASYRVYVGILEYCRFFQRILPSLCYASFDDQYRVEGLDFGTQYFFRMTGVCQNGTETMLSNQVGNVPMIKKLSDWSRIPEKDSVDYLRYISSLIKDVYDRAEEDALNYRPPHPKPKDLPPFPGS